MNQMGRNMSSFGPNTPHCPRANKFSFIRISSNRGDVELLYIRAVTSGQPGIILGFSLN